MSVLPTVEADAAEPAEPTPIQVAALQQKYRATAPADDYQRAMAAYQNLVLTGDKNAHNVRYAASGFGCVSIPKWAVVAYGWWLTGAGGVVVLASGALDGTIVGIPAGVVLGAIGVGEGTSGQALIHWADGTSWPKRICV